MSQQIEILLVEDNPADADLTTESFELSKIANRIHLVRDGEEAVAFLKREGQYKDAIRPDLILLDLNLPKKNGPQVLEEIKADPSLKQIPVVVLTSSQAEMDVIKCYNLHANCYLNKPVTLSGFQSIVSAIEGFWFAVVKFPPRPQ